MNTFALALKQLRSSWRAGELGVLLMSLALAVGAMTTVGFFTDRMQLALERQGSLLLGADLVVRSDRLLPASFARAAAQQGLATTQSMDFPSMVMFGEASALAEIKAVAAGYPLRGQLGIAPAPFSPARVAGGIPPAGEVWVEARLASQLGAAIGDSLAVGESPLKLTAILRQEPARGGDLFSIAPRLLMNIADVAASGLVQYGSRVNYRLLVAGQPRALADYRAWAQGHLEPGMRLEDLSSARPEIRSALEKSRQFLGLAATTAVLLSMVAMALAGLDFARRQLDTCALMRCFGASGRRILTLYLLQAVWLGVLGGVVGCLLGLAGQEGLARLAGGLLLEQLPPPGWQPLLLGLAAGLAAMLGVMLPHLLRLREVPALRVLRRDLGESGGASWVAWLPALGVMLALLLWSARDARLGGMMLAGVLAQLLLAGALTLAVTRTLRRLLAGAGGVARLALANLLRRPLVAVAQVAGLSLGLMAMLLLGTVRNDLLNDWQASLPADAPNRFVINIQSQQLDTLRAFFAQEQQPPPVLLPMVRGRLVEINGKPLEAKDYLDERARRLAEREFNLSWAAQMPPDNRLVAGRWWPPPYGEKLLSLEQGIAETLGIKLGDALTYDIGGRRLRLTVSSLRKVEWDSMRANFFAMTPPGVLEDFPASYITSFYLPIGQEELLNRLLKRLPNLTVIDVAALLAQVRGLLDRMALAVQFVFGFCLLAGMAVLYAALAASRDERAGETALLRVLGARRSQIRLAVLAEFAGIGLLSGAAAVTGASLLAWAVSAWLLHIPHGFNSSLALTALAVGGLLVPIAAWIGLRRVVSSEPKRVLNSF